MGTIFDCLHFKVKNLKLYYPKVSKQKIETFWLMIFSICNWCQQHGWCTLSCETELWKKPEVENLLALSLSVKEGFNEVAYRFLSVILLFWFPSQLTQCLWLFLPLTLPLFSSMEQASDIAKPYHLYDLRRPCTMWTSPIRGMLRPNS